MHSQIRPFFLNTGCKVQVMKMWKESRENSRLVYTCKTPASLSNLMGTNIRTGFFLGIRTQQSRSFLSHHRRSSYTMSKPWEAKAHTLLLLGQLQPLEWVSKPLPVLGCTHPQASTQTVPRRLSLSIKARSEQGKSCEDYFLDVRENLQKSLLGKLLYSEIKRGLIVKARNKTLQPRHDDVRLERWLSG